MTEPPAGWSVIVNEVVPSSLGRQIVQILPADSFENAVSVAEWVAVNHKPRNPTRPQRRDVFRVDDNSWLVQITGAMQTYYFTATIARWTGTYPQ